MAIVLSMTTFSKTPALVSPGVYCIYDDKSRFYIGSSVNLYERLIRHRADLRKSRHESNYLQNVYNKYGEQSLTIQILHYCEPSEVVDFEQIYLDLIQPHFNTYKTAYSPLGYRHTEESKDKMSKPYYLISPEGVEYEGVNLERFCRENGLKRNCICCITSGSSLYYKGWTTSWENHKLWKQKVGMKFIYQVRDSEYEVRISLKGKQRLRLGKYKDLELAKFSRDLGVVIFN